MKKILALALSVLMIFTCFVGCKEKTNDNLTNAVAYLENMYQTGKKDEPITINADKEVLSVVTIEGVSYNVEWAVTVTEGASDAVKIAEAKTENCVLIDIPDMPEADILFTATATVKDEKDNTATAEFSYKVLGIKISTGDDVGAVLDAAYALAEGAKMESETTLTGKIKSVDTPFSSQYKNVTVTIEIDGFADKPIKCYRLAGEGADTLAVGDTITVTGVLANYMGTIEFEQGCVLKSVVKGEGSDAPTTSTPTDTAPSGSLSVVTDQAKILTDAFALEDGKALSYIAVLKGKITSVDSAWSDEYGGQVSVTIKVGDKSIYCYKMKTDKSEINVTDEITVMGVIKNYQGTVEFAWDANSQTEVVLKEYTKGEGVQPSADISIVDNPAAGTEYKFGMVQENVDSNAVYYLTGAMKNTYYFGTTADSKSAINVTLEQANGGYYISTTIDGAKKYINMVVSGTHENAVYQDTATTIYTYDATLKTFVTTLETSDGAAKFAFGSYGTFTTVCPCNIEDDKAEFYCHFYNN